MATSSICNVKNKVLVNLAGNCIEILKINKKFIGEYQLLVGILYFLFLNSYENFLSGGFYMKKKFFTFLGFLFLIFGIIGAFLPIIPTVPFILIAAYFFEKSSDKFYNWLLTNRYFGEYLKDYRINRGITKRNKIIAIVSTIFGMTLGMFFMPFIIGKVLLFFILMGVIFHIIGMDTIKK